MKPILLCNLALVVAIGLVCQTTPEKALTIQGAWQPQTYTLKGGEQHPVDGLIFFTDKDWTVAFFVLGEDRQPKRGSAEGGTYSLVDRRLVFSHRFNLSAGEQVGGLPANPLRMEIRQAASASTEPCTIELTPERLTIFFPSGNSMTFRRSSGFSGFGL